MRIRNICLSPGSAVRRWVLTTLATRPCESLHCASARGGLCSLEVVGSLSRTVWGRGGYRYGLFHYVSLGLSWLSCFVSGVQCLHDSTSSHMRISRFFLNDFPSAYYLKSRVSCYVSYYCTDLSVHHWSHLRRLGV